MEPLPQKPSLVQYTANALRTAIRQGEWMEQLPGERQLCEKIQVSRPTLRRALAILEREGLLQTEHGKHRQICAQQPQTSSKSKRVIFLSPSPLQELEPFAIFEMEALRRRLSDTGYKLDFMTTSSFTHRDPAPYLAKRIAQTHAAVWILYRAPRTVQTWFQQHEIPAVIMGSSYPEVELPSVDIDFYATCRHAANLLLTRKHRPERITLFVPEADLAGIEESKLGFLKATGQENHKNIVVHWGDVHAVCQQINRLCIDPLRRPTGIIIQRPIYTHTVIGQLLAHHQLTIPRDISIIALDDGPSLQFAIPEITRYTKGIEQYARRLHKATLHMLQGEIPTTPKIRFMPEWIKGETLGPAPQE